MYIQYEVLYILKHINMFKRIPKYHHFTAEVTGISASSLHVAEQNRI